MKQACCGEIVPYCPGAARVEAGGNFPMESEDSSHRREQPLAPSSTPNEPRLITCVCCSPCWVYAETAKLEWPLQVQAWANDMEILKCPVPGSPFRRYWQSPVERQSRYNRCQRGCRSCQKVSQCSANCLRVSIPDFLSGFTPIAFGHTRPTCKAAVNSWRAGSFMPRADAKQLPTAHMMMQ